MMSDDDDEIKTVLLSALHNETRVSLEKCASAEEESRMALGYERK